MVKVPRAVRVPCRRLVRLLGMGERLAVVLCTAGGTRLTWADGPGGAVAGWAEGRRGGRGMHVGDLGCPV